MQALVISRASLLLNKFSFMEALPIFKKWTVSFRLRGCKGCDCKKAHSRPQRPIKKFYSRVDNVWLSIQANEGAEANPHSIVKRWGHSAKRMGSPAAPIGSRYTRRKDVFGISKPGVMVFSCGLFRRPKHT